MSNYEFLSKERIETTIRILEQVKNQGGQLDLLYFSSLDVDKLEEVHPCGNSACIIGYVSLSDEWAEAGGATRKGIPKLRGEFGFTEVRGSTYASLWFTGKELNEENSYEVREQRTLACVLAEAVCLLLDEEYLDDLSSNVQEELLNLLPTLEESGELNEKILIAITGKPSSAVNVEDAIKALEWLLTLEITK